ncbi:hypothetical protein CPC735_045080 [Coccidioides posadasii C735 delta SOWgp]|uniref:WD40 repeat protein n=1 Tax=Coccidioides posadasii (strain C735) TaxID=222929 RepID=C5PEI0_COCP7|nr:hypothetical protein CPC735_045080 [Coccidioides posadasii C735 delta SOWgp]EER23138.1 hypothetical protein CPC735_045080 [Coccidioides posadasii C735 delta SOWgp]|eukprot:XP_003065283.1 hypothetical protein CPC735_045080 [Coccidioides posadasii C735 delta SOWgp]
MAAVGSKVSLLANVWKLLGIRHDVDDIILELLGRFSLEKVYSECDPQTYQRLVIALLARLNAIYSLQRLSLPSESEQAGQYLGFLASWEVVVRSVEFILQIIIEGRDSFWEARPLRDKYLAELLCVALRILILHPKPPGGHRVKERKDRFARIHGSLEKLFDNYPDPKSFLLCTCKAITDVLRNDPNALPLPSKLRSELPNLTTQLYPLPECLSPGYVSTLVENEEASEQWLAQFLALRDVSHFVVGAFIQYIVDEETSDADLQASCANSRNAVLVSLDSFRIPQSLSKLEMIETFSEIFRLILPDTPNVSIEDASKLMFDEEATDAIHAFCLSLNDRQVVHRVSDAHLMNAMASILDNVALFVEPGPRPRSAYHRAYALNCPSCHFVEHFQFTDANNLKIPDPSEVPMIKLPEGTKCVQCGEAVTVAREISLVWQAWDALKLVECNADTIGVERHLPTQFQLLPKAGTCVPAQTAAGNHADIGVPTLHEPKLPGPYTPHAEYTGFSSAGPSDKPHFYSPDLVSPISPDQRHRYDSPFSEFARPEFQSSMNDTIHNSSLQISPNERILNSPVEGTLPPFGTDFSTNHIERANSRASFQPIPLSRTRTILTSDKKGKWMSKRRKDPPASSVGDTSSLSSGTLERQKMEEISLKDLISLSKVHGRGKGSKNINVYLSQNSTYALFWMQPSIHIWDVGMSPPTPVRAISTESSCLMAAVTKTYLAYVIGTRDQKLTLRIVNLVQPTALVLEYRMPSTLWCRSIAMSPKENYVVIGFENATVRFFRTTNTEQPREFRLHPYHKQCRGCPSVDTLSFSHDGIVLLASTRNPKMGMIQTYMWSFPFLEFRELVKCRYYVPLHESEDNGVSTALYRPSSSPDEDLVCITTWTQSGVPLLIQPENGHKAEIKPDGTRRLGNRIQCAAFSPSGNQLGLVNDKGQLYQLSNLNSSIMECRKLATSRELTLKSESFAMSYMSLHEEESVVLAWVEMPKGVAYIKKVPITSAGTEYQISTAGDVADVPFSELPGDTSLTTPEKPAKEPGRLLSPVFRQYMSFGESKRSQKKAIEMPANDIHATKRVD